MYKNESLLSLKGQEKVICVFRKGGKEECHRKSGKVSDCSVDMPLPPPLLMGRPFKTADREALVWKTGWCTAFSTINYYRSVPFKTGALDYIICSGVFLAEHAKKNELLALIHQS